MTRPNTGQRLALNLDAHIAIDAGAGTGKTRTIVDRAVQHYLANRQRATEILPQPERLKSTPPGKIRSSKSEMTEPIRWKGLLPGEVVLLTFTKAAANEMRTRLREKISNLKVGTRDREQNSDPRLRSEADKEQLTMLLEDAPIGTIHSFFSRLISPHLTTLGEPINDDIVTDAQRETLRIDAIDAFWRLPSDPFRFTASDSELLQSEYASSILRARDRLTKMYSGRRRLNGLLQGLLRNSILVEEASRELSGEMKIEHTLLMEILFPEESHIFNSAIFNEIHQSVSLFIDLVKNKRHIFSPDGWNKNDRVELLNHLAETHPDTFIEKISWISKLMYVSKSKSLSTTSKIFPRDTIPSTENWPSGILPLGKMGQKKESKEAKEQLKESVQNIRELLESNDASEILRYATTMSHLEPVEGVQSVPYPPPERIQDDPDIDSYTMTIESEADHLEDLRLAMFGLMEILRGLKLRDRMRDHDDSLRLAGDLLLLNCPRICKIEGLYPSEVIRILDRGPKEPWQDDHIEKALHQLHSMIGEDDRTLSEAALKQAAVDLEQRFCVLKSIRRRFRAFIIDEAQDNSPLQWRLLARLWGPREIKPGENEIPETPWQPTICYVGDIKQSIYAFRQAEPSRFREYSDHLRSINSWELDNIPILSNDPPLRSKDRSRDPRHEHEAAFATAGARRIASGRDLEPWVRFDQVDGPGETISPQDIEARSEGLIRLDVNFRTKSGLLNAMNEWWRDVFSERHRTVRTGSWYADAQDLRSPSQFDMCYGDLDEGDPSLGVVQRLQGSGYIEWICPSTEEIPGDPPEDLEVPVNPLFNEQSGNVDRIARLIAMRVKSLIEGKAVRIKSAEGVWISQECAPVKSDEIMILMATRSGIRDALLRELSEHGINAHADQEGDLFERPAASVIEALFQFCARPHSKHHAAWVLRSPLIGLSDNDLDKFILAVEEGENLMQKLALFLKQTPAGRMVERWIHLLNSGRVLDVLNETLDSSDLLIAYPDEISKQDAEQAIDVIAEILDREGGSIIMAGDVLRALREDLSGGIKSKTKPSSDAIRMMSIHGSKGLQSKVVILADLFSDRMVKISNSPFTVSADLFSGNPRPWGGKKNLKSAVWEHARWINKSRKDAENRRLLYVAATRVQDRLIVVGSPEGRDGRNSSKWIEGEGLSFIHDDRKSPPLGHMITNALRAKGWLEDRPKSKWLTLEDREQNAIPTERGTISLDPVELLNDSSISNPANSPQFLLMHSSECFESEIAPNTPYTRFKTAVEALSRTPIRKLPANMSVKSPLRKLKIAPSTLHVDDPEIAGPVIQNHSKNQKNNFTAAQLGTIVHRVIEVGIGHPGGDSKPPLPSSWTTFRPNRLSEISVIKSAISGIGLDPESSSLLNLVSMLTSRIENGHLGKLVSGEPVSGHRIHGHRTELPFTHSRKVDFNPIIHGPWSPEGYLQTSIESQAIIQIEGLIDLVICTQDERGRPTIRAVDIKTDGSMGVEHSFETPLEGHEPQSQDELNLLRRHGIQLAIYHEALEAMNLQTPEESRRLLLPPAIVWARNGRMIAYPDNMLRYLRSELGELLSLTARTHLNPVEEKPHNLGNPQ